MEKQKKKQKILICAMLLCVLSYAGLMADMAYAAPITTFAPVVPRRYNYIPRDEKKIINKDRYGIHHVADYPLVLSISPSDYPDLLKMFEGQTNFGEREIVPRILREAKRRDNLLVYDYDKQMGYEVPINDMTQFVKSKYNIDLAKRTCDMIQIEQGEENREGYIATFTLFYGGERIDIEASDIRLLKVEKIFPEDLDNKSPERKHSRIEARLLRGDVKVTKDELEQIIDILDTDQARNLYVQLEDTKVQAGVKAISTIVLMSMGLIAVVRLLFISRG